MDYAKFIRAACGNATNSQIESGAKECAAMLVSQFGASAVQQKLREIFGSEVVPAVTVAAPKPAASDFTAQIEALRKSINSLETQIANA